MYIIYTASKIALLLLYLIFSKMCDTSPHTRKIVIDTDPGGDDALAIILAIMYEAKTSKIEILAITATYGNTNLENTQKNLLKILTIADKKIPIYIGAEKPLINEYEDEYYFGLDGFGDFNFTQEITAKVDKSKNASVALVDLVKQYPNEITVITLGPLTTIATAIVLEPNFLNLIKQHVMMGASTKNETEFNFKLDPESDWIVFNNVSKPSVVVPIETVHSHAFSKEEYRNLYNKLNASIASFLYQAERKGLAKQEMWLPADAIAVAIALQQDIVRQSFVTNLTPVLLGDKRGSSIINSDSQMLNVEIIEHFNRTEFEHMILKYLSN